MTGKITVGTIQDTDGNTVASTYVTNGVAKIWFGAPDETGHTIAQSLNISGSTDNGTGDFAVNLSNAMPDTNYSIAGASGLNSTNNQTYFQMEQQTFGSTSVIDIAIRTESGSRIDSQTVSMQVFR